MKPKYLIVEKEINKKLYEINGLLASCRKPTLTKLLEKVDGYSSTNCGWISKWAQQFTARLVSDNIAVIDKKRAAK